MTESQASIRATPRTSLQAELFRLRAALTARDKAIEAAEEALKKADTELWSDPDVLRSVMGFHIDAALAALAAVKETH